MDNNGLPFFSKYSSVKLYLTFILILFFLHVKGQQPPYLKYLGHPWVDSVLATLSTDERIAQLIWIVAGSDEDISHFAALDHIIRQHGIGGVLFHEGNTDWQARLIKHYQSVSQVPLAIAMDGEWGPYPSQLCLEAIADDSLRYRAGSSMARQLRRHGMHILRAPVSDVHVRAGFQDNNVLAAGKAIQRHKLAVLDSALIQLPGFKQLITDDTASATGLAGCYALEGLDACMVIGQIRSLLENGTIDEEAINQRTRTIMALKYWSVLHGDPSGNHADDKAFIRDLYQQALTVLKNEDQSIPVKDLEKKKIACIAVNQPSPTAFQEMVSNYTWTDHFSCCPGGNSEDSLLEKLKSYDVVLAGIYQRGDARGTEAFLSSLSDQVHLISVIFDDPCAIGELEGLESSEALVLAYQHNNFTEELAAQLIFGGIGGQGRLPVRIDDEYPAGHGISTVGHVRLQYAYPENAGVSSETLNRNIDSIVLSGLEAGAYPGCEVIAARRGMVIFHKTYGYHTYDARIEVQKQDLYDLASVTKVSAPLAGLMLLEGMGKFYHADRLGDYAPSMKGSDKADLGLRDVLAHQAGLHPYLLYWKNTVTKGGNYKRRYLRDRPSEKFSVQVADRIYLKSTYRKKIYREIKKSALGEKKYVYSGLSFLLFPEIIEELSGERYEDFLSENIYHPLGAWDIVFNPYRFYPLSRIAPTEIDTLFRRQLVHGFVHDEAAAMMGGYSGNAGLFSTANDLLKLFEMYRRMGNYGGEQIIAEDILKEYTRCQFPENRNRRGLGFDKPSLGDNDGTESDYPCPGASPSSFGHSGFTGTFAWADPEHEISYVFLCNRVYPTRENDLLSEMNIRTAILQCIYDSIIE